MTERIYLFRISLLLLMLCPACLQAAEPLREFDPRTDSLIAVYDALIGKAPLYIAVRQAEIDSLKAQPSSPANTLRLAELYVPYQSDSALHYYSRALAASDDELSVLAGIRRMRMLASIGNYDAAFREREQMPAIPEQYRVAYCDAMYRLYNEAAMSAKLRQYGDAYWAEANAYADTLIAFCEARGLRPLEYLRQCITRANRRRDYMTALAYTDEAMQHLTPEQHEYAIFAFERAIIYREMGDTQAFYQWLLRSAITDVRCGITDNGSSWMIAVEAYNRGDIERAYKYINYSVSNANTFNANPRYQQIAPLALMISRTYEDAQQQFNFRLWAAVIALVAVILAVIAAVLVAHRRNRELRDLNGQLRVLNGRLEESNMVKEQYICRYLEVYSDMIDRMARMARKTEKDPDAFLRKEMASFYLDFDRTFLTLYPTFVNDFNALLRPEARILPKQGDILTTELRIFALVRLGIDASAKIAQLLRYAPNTIYNYRAQIRNAALSGKEDFERQVRRIGRSVASGIITCLALLLAVVLPSCGGDPNNPQHRKPIVLQQGCYTSSDTAYVLVFPEGQHDGQYVSLTQLGEAGMEALVPEVLTDYNDSTGQAVLYVLDTTLGMRTNGKDSLWIYGDSDTIPFVRKAEVDYAPRSLTGQWKLSYPINEYMSLRILDAVIADDLYCDITFNIPDSAQLATMIEMAGAVEGMEDISGMLPEGMTIGQLLEALPKGMTGIIWYSAYAGMGVFVPDSEDFTSDYGLFFTTPNGKTIRLEAAGEGLDMTRIK